MHFSIKNFVAVLQTGQNSSTENAILLKTVLDVGKESVCFYRKHYGSAKLRNILICKNPIALVIF